MVSERFDPRAQAAPSLRDWYAGLALLGLWIRGEQDFGIGDAGVAERAFAVADAMMDRRSAAPCEY